MPHKNNNSYFLALITAALLLSLLAVTASSEHPTKSRTVSAKSAVLYEPESGRFLYSKNAFQRLPMASTTKIMTALVAAENSALSETVVIPPEAEGVEGSSAYLKAGEEFTMEELLYALLLRSANDAAVAIACHISGSVEAFAEAMNERAFSLGLTDTNFTNPHGLDDPEHYTTAHDLALIAAEAMSCDLVREICSTYKRGFVHDDAPILYVNHNKLLKSYDGAIGVKTGYTKKSGRCLVGAAERDGLTFITVTLDAPDDWRDHEALFDLGFSALEKITLLSAGDHRYSLPVLDGVQDTVEVENITDDAIILERGEHDVKEYVKLAKFATAPIKAGDIFGEIIFTLDGEVVSRVKLVATEDVERIKDKNFLKKLIESLGF